MKQVMLHGFWQSERGFSLMELVWVIILMGIVFAAAVPIWLGAVESRKVDSATNQMVADLRRAHTNSTNRLEDWQVHLNPEAPSDSSDYHIGPCEDPCAGAPPPASHSLEEGTEFAPGTTLVKVVFKPSGEAQVTGGGNIKVAALDNSPCRQIQINTLTSRVEVLPNAC